MKQLLQKQAIILAALLQVLPLTRHFVANPSATSTYAVILRWAVGSSALLGAYDACSASSLPYFMPLQTNIVMTVGVYYTNSIIVTNVGTDPGAYFELTNSVGLDSGQIVGRETTTICLPAGITLKCYDTAASKRWYYAALYGTPTTVSGTSRVNVDAGFSGAGDIYTNIFFTVLGGVSPPLLSVSPPQGNVFRLTFTPAIGVTNVVETNSLLVGGSWNPLTNIPPPASATAISVTDMINGVSRFYRVKLTP